jgi:predicted small secreted protein
MKKSIRIAFILLGLAAVTLSSCNTMAGAGEDLQKAGSALTNRASQ